MSFALLVSFVEEPDIFQLPVPERDVEGFDGDCAEILPEDVPVGDSVEDRRCRQGIIKQFYFYWKKRNPELCKFNIDLDENIYINHTSYAGTSLP